MKKNLKAVAIAATALSLFVACQNEPANNGNTKNNAPVEQPANQNAGEEAKDAPEAAEGEIAEVGLALDATIKGAAKEGENPAKASSNGNAALVAFDSEGKIVDVKFDVVQPSITVDEAGVLGEYEEVESKFEQGEKYGMKKASPIEKEWDEQAEAFEAYIVGKTAEEVAAIPTKVKDEKHQNVPDTPDLASTVTIDIGSFQTLVEEAYKNKVAAPGATAIGLKVSATNRSKPGEGDKPTSAGFNISATGVAIDGDGKIVQTILDVAQPSIEVAENGFAEASEIKTKKELGTEYGMKKASEIGLEWDEQAANFEAYTVGKTAEEVAAIPTKVKDENHQNVPDTPDLASTVSIDIKAFQEGIVEAVSNAKAS